MQPLTIRHSRPMGITFVGLGVLIALVSLLTSAWVTVAAGVVLTALGVLQLVNPMLRIEAREFAEGTDSRTKRLQHLVLQAGIANERFWVEYSQHALDVLRLPKD